MSMRHPLLLDLGYFVIQCLLNHTRELIQICSFRDVVEAVMGGKERDFQIDADSVMSHVLTLLSARPTGMSH